MYLLESHIFKTATHGILDNFHFRTLPGSSPPSHAPLRVFYTCKTQLGPSRFSKISVAEELSNYFNFTFLMLVEFFWMRNNTFNNFR